MIPVSQDTPAETHALPRPQDLADLYGIPVVDLRRETVDRDVVDLLPLHVLARTRAVPYRFDGGRLSVAIADPREIQLIDDLKLVSSYPIDLAVASEIDIDFELKRLLRSHEVVVRAQAMEDELPGYVQETTDLAADDGVSETPPIKLVNSIVVQAVEDEASDIHFLPREDALIARIRVDGVLHEIERIPKAHAAGVISRIKVLAKLDIAEHRVPQDGRFTIRAAGSGRLNDVRVAVLPTVEGEGAIIRLFDKSRRAPTLTEIGLSNEMQMALEDVLYRPTGAFFAVGPTGSGKSTTVYAALADMRRPEVNVITIEDPVEYRLEDVYQLQVNNRVGLTFASGSPLHPALRPRRRDGRRGARPRDGEDHARGGAHGSRGALDAALERRAGGDQPSQRPRHRAVHDRVGGDGRPRAAPRPPPLYLVPRAVPAGPEDARGPRLPGARSSNRGPRCTGGAAARGARRVTAAGRASTS